MKLTNQMQLNLKLIRKNFYLFILQILQINLQEDFTKHRSLYNSLSTILYKLHLPF